MCTRKGGDRVFGIPARRVICPTIQIFQCPLSGVWNLGTGHPDPSPIPVSSLPEGRQQLLHPHLIPFKCSDDHDVGGRRIKFVREGLAMKAGQSAVKEGSETFSDIALRGTLWSSRFETMEATPSDIFGSLGRMWSSPNKSMRLNRWVIFYAILCNLTGFRYVLAICPGPHGKISRHVCVSVWTLTGTGHKK
jgi:hypothetical protein